jgi:hypothetical protein
MSSPRHPLTEVFDHLAEILAPVVDKVRELIRDLEQSLEDVERYRKQRAESLKPTAPARIDTRHVTHTDSKPPKPTTVYRRRTP